MQPFDAWKTDLEPGTTLIEASAGTGKTYAIVNLVLRLLLERKLTLDQILVVTFTEAATAELRGRIRSALRNAQACFSPEENSQRNKPGDLPDKWRKSKLAPEQIRLAMDSLDLAQIKTIHGFCATVLSEKAFETGALFEAELIESEAELLRELVEDFWRKNFYAGSVLEAEALAQAGCSVDQLVRIASQFFLAPNAVLETDGPILPLAEARSQLAEIFDRVCALWPEVRLEVETKLRAFAHAGKIRKGYTLAGFNEWTRSIDAALQFEETKPGALGWLTSLDQANLEAISFKRAKGSAPQLPFFEECSRLAGAVANFRRAVIDTALRFVQEESRRRKSTEAVRGYADLMSELTSRLTGSGGDLLRSGLRQRFAAVLIDEFQDTDPLQHEIFSNVFAHSPDHFLFFIGDPKQSIFGFRGADIFAYIRARNGADRTYTLNQNWRSRPELVAAQNELYQKACDPFVVDAIQFHPILATEGAKESLWIGDKRAPGLSIHAFPPDYRERNTWRDQFRLTRWAAAYAVKLLRAGARIGDRSLRPSDIAILTRRNADAETIQAELRMLGVPAVLQKTGNLYESAEAAEIELAMRAIIEPSKFNWVRGALTTGLFGLTGDDLARLHADETKWEDRLARFRRYQQVWLDDGFAAMFQQLLAGERVLERLLKHPGGERRAVNYLHLMECLHAAGRREQLGPGGLVSWLQQCRTGANSPVGREAELRLESDSEAIQIITMHRSKGLEFPVVIAPHLWTSSFSYRNTVWSYHKPEEDFTKAVFVGESAPQEIKDAANLEAMAEDARLIYVALTRAVQHCAVAWRGWRKAEESAFERIVSPMMIAEGLSGAGQTPSISYEPIELERVAPAAGGRGEDDAGAGELSARQPPPHRIYRSWRILSFSSLKAELEAQLPQLEQEEPDYVFDETAPETAPAADDSAPPKSGTKLGTLLHRIFEKHQFDKPEELPGLVAENLRAFGYDSRFQPWFEERIRATLDIPLLAGFSLAQLGPGALRKELEFYFPVNHRAAERFARILDTAGPEKNDLPALSLGAGEGFMKGFIDLVFVHRDRYYLLDWKSNDLGAMENYGRAGIEETMRTSRYVLQYHLYLVALHRFLKLTLPGYSYDSNFGGVFYLFLRGIDSSGRGIFFDRPKRESVEMIEHDLIESR